MEDALQARHFRADLYHRLNVIRIEIPPLRERPEDIEALVDVLLQRASIKLERPVIGMTAHAMRWLLSYEWPGNVRELAHIIERAVALTDHDTILLEDLAPASSLPDTGRLLDDTLSTAAVQGLSLAELERAYICRVLETTQGNKARAARILGLDRQTLYRKLDESEPADE